MGSNFYINNIYLYRLLMGYIKTFTSIIVVLIVIVLFYSSFSSKAEYELDRAGEEFIKGDFTSAEIILRKLKHKISDSEYHLYLAYIKREKESLESSNKHLQLAKQSLICINKSHAPSSRIALEIYLNEIYNAFLVGNAAKMTEPLRTAMLIRKDNIWIGFFKALQAFLQKDYLPALQEWQEQAHAGYLSPWMRKIFGEHFDSLWYSLHLCSAKIAVGDFIEARQHLQNLRLNASVDNQAKINLLMGLSYLKEGEKESIISSTPYYKEAIYHLSQVVLPMKCYNDEQIQIRHILKKQTQALIEAQIFEDISFYANVMTKWNTIEDLESLKYDLVLALNQKIQEADGSSIHKIAQALNHVVIDPEQRHNLQIKFEDLFHDSLEAGSLTDLGSHLEIMRLFARDPAALNKYAADQVAAYIFQLIPIDNEDLCLTASYFDYWMKIDSGRDDHYALAAFLIAIGEKFWNIAEHGKALKLFKLSVSLPYLEDQPKLYATLMPTLKKLCPKLENGDQGICLELFNIINPQNSSKNDEYKRQGFKGLKNNKPLESLEWFSKITPISSDVTAGKSLAYFLSQQWEKALEEYKNLPVNYAILPAMKRILLESHAALGDFHTCNNILAQLFKTPQQLSENITSPIFLEFKEQFLDYQTPEFVAGIFYHKWKNDTSKGLEYFRKIPKLTPEVSFAIGKTLWESKKYQEAYDVLMKAFPMDNIQNLKNTPTEEAISLLAQVEEALDYQIEAAVHYAAYYELFSSNVQYREHYAKILMSLHRYIEALTQWEFIAKSRPLSDDEKISTIKCLIHLDQFNEADKRMLAFFSEDSHKPFELYLELGEFLFITGNHKLLNDILSKVPEPSQRSFAINQALLNLWIEIGEYEKALELLEAIKPLLEQTPEGLCSMALLYSKLSNHSLALNLVKKAQNLDPYNTSVSGMIDALEMEELELSSLKHQRIVLQKLLQTSYSPAALKIEYVKKIIAIAHRKQQCFDKSLDPLPEWQEIHKILKDLIELYPNVPVLYLLLGKTQSLTNERVKAKESFERVLKLDGSNVEAMKNLSFTDPLPGDPLSRIQDSCGLLKKALKYAPNDASLWNRLADLYLKEKEWFSAVIALKNAVKFQPNREEAFFKLARLQLILENAGSEQQFQELETEWIK